MDLKSGTIIITGATSGFGEAIARLMAGQWPRAKLLLTGRRREKLDALAKELGAKVACFDIRDRSAVEKFAADHQAEIKNTTVLVNNAGLAAGLATFQDSDIDDWEQMIDTNVKGLLYITRAVLPAMIANGQGHIVNMSSVSGKKVYPKGHVYNATKFAVTALSEALRMDTLGTGVRVTDIEPGMAETEFSLVRFKGDADKAKSVYKGIKALEPRDVAEAVLWSLDRPAHVNIQELLIMPTNQATPQNAYRE
jgi:3-hydroxy acid dehydrogenase/malonic semialdehyde reductase